MFSLKKKNKQKGIQGGAFPPAPVPSDSLSKEELVDPPFQYLEQHHKKTMNSHSFLLTSASKSSTTAPTLALALTPPSATSTTNINTTATATPAAPTITTTAATPSSTAATTSTNSKSVQICLNDSSPPMHLSGLDYLSGDESDNYHNQMEHLRSQFYTSDPQKRTREYHMEQASQAVELLKAASKPEGWKKVDKHKSGCVVYQSTSAAAIPNHGDNKYPAFKGEHIIRGYKAQDVFSIVGVRKLWDDWYDELTCIDAYDDATTLLYMVMKGTLSARTRDIAMVERIDIEKDGTTYVAACSVESSKVPAVSGKVRAIIFLAGWIIQPLPSNPPITKITYVIQTDLLSRLPKFIAKRSLIKRAMVIATVETYLRKNGPPTLKATPSTKSVNRHRSLSEPVKLDHFLLPPESDDEDDPTGSSFLSPLDPGKSKQDIRYLDESGAESSAEEPPIVVRRVPQQGSSKTKTPVTRNSLATSTLFSKEFIESSSFMSDQTLFGDRSSFFGKSSSSESVKKQDEPPPLPASPRPQPTHTKRQGQERSSERTRDVTSEKIRPVPTPRAASFDKLQTQKRISIPVVAPKSEARMRTYNASTNQLGVPETGLPLTTPDSLPLTPPASVDGKDNTSDSDAAHSSSDVIVVPRIPKNDPVEAAPVSPTIPSMAPSAMMQATTRRHSALFSRPSAFVPRHSTVPIRGNPNVSLQSLTRPSGPNGTMTTAMKRHSMAPSLESNKSSTTFTPIMVLPHRHSETARKALAMFKVLASSPEDRWRAISSENGFKSYSRVISGAGLPMLRGEGTITGGWTVEQINAVIESSGSRQVWDERFENMSIAETFNHNEYLFHITLRGIGSLTGRDLAGVTIIDRDPLTSALYNVSTSVLDPTIPEDPGRIRAMLELSGWSLRPTFDGQGNTVSVNVTFVIQIDIRGNLPSSVVKSMTASMTTAVSRLNQFINKSGYPPFASHISGTRLLDTFDPKTGFYELCYKAAPGWTEVRIGRKVYKEGYDFFIKPDDPSVRVEMAPDFGGVRVWTTLDHEGQSIAAQVSRKGQHAIAEPEPVEESQDAEEQAHSVRSSRYSEVDPIPNSRKRRSASNPSSSTRPESQASAASDRSRSRGRAPRSIVTIPVGAPPPPLPRRSSSLTRYSIPLSAYIAPEDAPPVPVNAAVTSVAATIASEITPSPRPISESLGSPTLGFFHVPVVPAANSAAAASASESSNESNTIFSASAAIASMDNISSVLSENAAATSVAPEDEIPGATTVSIASAQVTENSEVVAVTIAEEEVSKPASPKDVKVDELGLSLLSSQQSPVNTPVPSPMASAFVTRGSPLPSSLNTDQELISLAAAAVVVAPVMTVSPTTTSPTAPVQPASSLKSSTSYASLGGAVRRREQRVTFSLDTVDKSASSADDSSVKSPSSPVKEDVEQKAEEQMLSQQEQLSASKEEMDSSDDESDDGEFVEARDELSEDEMELALVLTGVSAWTALSTTEKKQRGMEMVKSSAKAVESGVSMVTLGAPMEVKVAIVFMLLFYYAGRLASFMA